MLEYQETKFLLDRFNILMKSALEGDPPIQSLNYKDLHIRIHNLELAIGVLTELSNIYKKLLNTKKSN